MTEGLGRIRACWRPRLKQQWEMNRLKRILGLDNVLERAWAETQVDAPDTVTLASEAEAAQAMEALRHAALAATAVQGEHRAAS